MEMSYGEMADLLLTQCVDVEFVDASRVGCDVAPEDGMRARLLSIAAGDTRKAESPENDAGTEKIEPAKTEAVKTDESDDVLHVFFDLSPFEEYNRTKAEAHAQSGQPCKNWFDSGICPENGLMDFFVDGPMDRQDTVFRVVVSDLLESTASLNKHKV